ncbi:hypothetical protein [Deinococcus misasensis]|uniref:hypothetical protein n=1 Tax=Deinococcus misasensis TaxID=392413 RepID=UPI00054FE191|nr:hypothetical protein [Deinococcus misasensis]
MTLEIRFAGEKASCTAVFTIAPIGFVAGQGWRKVRLLAGHLEKRSAISRQLSAKSAPRGFCFGKQKDKATKRQSSLRLGNLKGFEEDFPSA